jgi:hypothetical protein
MHNSLHPTLYTLHTTSTASSPVHTITPHTANRTIRHVILCELFQKYLKYTSDVWHIPFLTLTAHNMDFTEMKEAKAENNTSAQDIIFSLTH